MQAEVSEIKDKEIELKMKDEDISIMYIVQHHLLNNKEIDFAGVVMKHPLLKEFVLKVNLKNNKSHMKIIEDAIDESNNYCDELVKLIQAV